jgi:dipeptidyl aminopeptidase/acylaminoacyl peptidase
MTRRKPRGVPVARLFSATEINGFAIHPEGGFAACSINRGANWELAFVDFRKGGIRRFLAGEQSLLAPAFSPNGASLAYHADFEGNENHDIFVASLKGKENRKLTDGVADNQQPEFSPDGTRVAFISNRENDIENVYVMSSDGGPIEKVSDEELPVKCFAWSPDGSTIAYGTGIGDEDYVSIARIGNERTKKVLSRRNVEYGLMEEYGSTTSPWSPDGRKLLFTSNENDPRDIGELDLAHMKTRWVVRSANEKYAPQYSPEGDALAYLEVVEPNLVLKLRRGGRTTRLSQEEGFTKSVRWLPSGEGLVYINGSATRPDEMFMVKAGRPRQVTRLLRKRLPGGSLVTPQLVRYESFDGRKISGLLFLPKKEGRRAGIVMPHGGPEMQILNEWDQLAQMLAMKGFAVLQPNYRGSTGYGREFLHLHDKDLGGGDLLDTLFAGKYMVDSGIIDDDKLGFWGASYGGYLCLMALTKEPSMWAAGVSIVGFFDWETEFATERGYLQAYDRKKMGDPKENPELFRDRSPVHFLDRLLAPLLMTASSRDVRCPPTESRAVVEKLRKMGKTVEYHEYPDEGHWPRKRKNLKDLYTRSARFLDEHIPR